MTEIEKQVGKPYRITSQQGTEHYYYLERIQIGPNLNAQNTYVLTVKDGTIIDKQCYNEAQSFQFQIR